MAKRKWFVTAMDEDGITTLYGPVTKERAAQMAEDIFTTDETGNVITHIVKPLPDWEDRDAYEE